MSIGICRVQKVSGASGGVGAYLHNERIRDHSNTNPDIDFHKSAGNYHIGEYDSALTYNQRAEERLADGYKGKRAVRKDAVRLVEVLFTSDKAFFEGQPDNGRAYFKNCLKWASERFGEDNIIADIVHLDEATPHMHLDFVPLTDDGRLSAKEVLGDKQKLQELQDDFYEKVGKKYGLERGQRANLNAGESGRKNLTVQELKLKTLQKEIKNLSKLRSRVRNDVSELQRDKEDILAKMTDLHKQKTVLQREINALKDMKKIQGNVLSNLQAKNIKTENVIFDSEKVKVDKNDMMNLQKSALMGAQADQIYKAAMTYLQKAEKILERVENKRKEPVKETIERVMLKKKLENYDKALDRCDIEVKRAFENTLKTITEPQKQINRKPAYDRGNER